MNFKIKITILSLIIMLIGVCGFIYKNVCFFNHVTQLTSAEAVSTTLSDIPSFLGVFLFSGITFFGALCCMIIVNLYDNDTFGWKTLNEVKLKKETQRR